MQGIWIIYQLVLLFVCFLLLFGKALPHSGGLSPGDDWDVVTRCGWGKL